MTQTVSESLGYDPRTIGVSVIHIGPGAFHRAHQAVYTHDVIAKTGGDYGICEVSLRSPGARDALKPQDWQYTLAILDHEISYQRIGAIRDVLVAPEDPAAVISRLADQAIKTVTLTITEKGYTLGADGKLDEAHADIVHDLTAPDAPRSAVGLLVAGLAARKAAGLDGLTIISCDNLPDNGEKLGAALIAFARLREAALATWIAETCQFPSTMVDSITPKTDDALRARVKDATGFADAWPIQREAFTQWVIEDVPGATMPPWDQAGATFTGDVSAYERTKLRVLNGLHSSMVFSGLLLGLETVEQGVNHPVLRPFLERLCAEEILPSLSDVTALDTAEYAKSIFARFENPAIEHKLSQIAWDSSQKLPIRILGTLMDNIEAGRPSDLFLLVVAAWMEMVCLYEREDRELVDPMADTLLACARSENPIRALFALEEIFPKTLASDPSIAQKVEDFARQLREDPEKALQSQCEIA